MMVSVVYLSIASSTSDACSGFVWYASPLMPKTLSIVIQLQIYVTNMNNRSYLKNCFNAHYLVAIRVINIMDHYHDCYQIPHAWAL